MGEFGGGLQPGHGKGFVTDASALYVFYSVEQRDLEMRGKGSALSRKI